MKNFRDLMVWQKAHALTLASYRGTAEFPKQEIYGLISQIRRCSASMLSAECSKLRRFREIKLPDLHRRHHHVERFLSAGTNRGAHRLDIR